MKMSSHIGIIKKSRNLRSLGYPDLATFFPRLKIFKKFMIINILLGILVIATSAVPVDIPIVEELTKQKLKVYADNNLRETLSYSDFKVLRIEKFDEFVIIYFRADGKEQRWFKPIKSFDRLVK